MEDRDRGTCRVHRDTLRSEEVFFEEQRRIFNGSWLYVGHGSEVEAPGDFRRRTVGGRPLIFVRGRDGKVRAFFNSCTHRGATLCREDEGNAKAFQCFYHAWVFTTTGELNSMPDRDGYSPDLDVESLALRQPAQFDSYRDFYFVNYSLEAPSLADYLGDATEMIDLTVDQSRDGLRVIRGHTHYTVKSNWKLNVENTLDGYHGEPLHTTYFSYMKEFGSRRPTGWYGDESRTHIYPHGHAAFEMPPGFPKPIAHWNPFFGEEAKPDIERLRAEVIARLGEERGSRVCDYTRNLIVFPNFTLADSHSIFARTVEPVGVDTHEVRYWQLAPREESGAALARRLDNFISFLGPGGFATPDDAEALEACQQGYSIGEVEWNDISRGMRRDPKIVDEAGIRAYWRHWTNLMTGSDLPLADRPVGHHVGA
ncbi:MAG: aromatic ring-hydroxylating dioxygenase subunit alpha [Actinomycetota bacterium]|nr:MAG: aromatic ring-hydroxylating dioxygenase subunit alpha [Actinomycetota bacterium]